MKAQAMDDRPLRFVKADLRPELLPLFTAFFIVGLNAGAALAGKWLLLFGALTIGGLGMSFVVRFRGWGSWVPFALAAIGVGGLNASLRPERVVPAETYAAFNGNQGILEGVFVGEFHLLKKGGVSFLMEGVHFQVASQTVEFPGHLRCRVRSQELLPEPGQWYRGVGTLHFLAGQAFPLVDCPKIVTISPALFPGRLVGWIQRSLRDRIATLLPARQQSLLVAFLLGDTSTLGQSDRKLFQRTGVTHLMAVSGQNVMLVVIFLAAVLTWLRIPPLSRGAVVLGMLVLYGFLTVGNSSVWRAIFMYLAGVLAVNLEADPGPMRPLALTALLLLLANPPWLANIGFQLSFAAVLGIVFGRLPIEKRLCGYGLPLLLARYLAVSLAANFGTLPLVAYHFGTVSLVSFLANPLLVWMFSVIMPVGMLLPVLGWLWEPLGVIVGSGLSLFLDLFLAGLEFCGAVPYAAVQVGEIPGVVVALIYSVLLGIVSPTGLWRGELVDDVSRQPGSRMPGQPGQPGHLGKPGKPGQLGQQGSKAGPAPSAGVGEKMPVALPAVNPLAIPGLVEAIDQQLAVFPKRSLKGRGHFETIIFPVRQLSLEGQTLYHRLDDLTREVLTREPDRLLQGQVFLMALLGTELMARVVPRLDPPPTPADIPVGIKVKNRYLAMALLADGFFQSPLPGRGRTKVLARTIEAAQRLHIEALGRLFRFTRSREVVEVTGFLEGRARLLEWLKESADLAPEPEPDSRRSSQGHQEERRVK